MPKKNNEPKQIKTLRESENSNDIKIVEYIDNLKSYIQVVEKKLQGSQLALTNVLDMFNDSEIAFYKAHIKSMRLESEVRLLEKELGKKVKSVSSKKKPRLRLTLNPKSNK